MVAFIDAQRGELGVGPIITVLCSVGVAMAPSTYYDTKARPPSARARRDAVLGPASGRTTTASMGSASCGKPLAVAVMTSAGISWTD